MVFEFFYGFKIGFILKKFRVLRVYKMGFLGPRFFSMGIFWVFVFGCKHCKGPWVRVRVMVMVFWAILR